MKANGAFSIRHQLDPDGDTVQHLVIVESSFGEPFILDAVGGWFRAHCAVLEYRA